MDCVFRYGSPLGGICLASDGTALIGLWFEGQKHFGSTLTEEHEQRCHPVFDEAAAWLDRYFAGERPGEAPLLHLRGTVFQRAVWALLREIPYGKTVSYGQLALTLAERTGRERVSARSVGAAVGRNPISLIVPCHRVLGADGSLTGYAGGLERKRRLLALEGILK